MDRKFAVVRLARHDLEGLSGAERAEQLEVMLLEGWEDDPRWRSIPTDVRKEFTAGELAEPTSDPRYDPVLLLWLASLYAAATNEFLLARLRDATIDADSVTGDPVHLEACPCCGYRTISTRGQYEICGVCWWEDDGQDDDDADDVLGGPNAELSLTQGRINVLKHGISDPGRDDLRDHQDPLDMYARGREFVLSSDGASVSEV